MLKPILLRGYAHCISPLKQHALVALIVCLVFTHKGMTQTQNKADSIFKQKTNITKKHRFFFYWGYNRVGYSNSDIHFKGDGYDFTIANVKAHDEQEPLSSTYFNPSSITVAQYNYGLGYYITDHTFITVGQDHMKYRITKQTTLLTGYVNKDNNNGNTIGTYNNTEVLVGEKGYDPSTTIEGENSLKSGFVSNFENCDGLNDISVQIGEALHLWASRNGKHSLDATAAVGTGVEVVDTDGKILGYESNHNYNGGKTFHLAGFSGSAIVGIEFTFFKHFFIQVHEKGGYINLPDMKTTVNGGKANQHLWFIESLAVVGYSFIIGKN